MMIACLLFYIYLATYNCFLS